MRGRERVLVAAVVLVVMLLPLLSLLPAGAGACLADPLGEIQVKLWVYDAFLQPGRLFGGVIDEIRHPTPGLLNNPDLVGTLVIGGLNGLLGDCAAYNLLVSLQLGANALAAWWLGRQWGGDDLAGLGAAISIGLLPLLLVYCVAGAVTDMLNLWPYLLSLYFMREGWASGRALPALAAGGLLGVGFITCPYNVLVFAPAILPVGVTLYLGGLERFGLEEPADWRVLMRWVALVALGGVLVGGPYLAWMQLILVDPDSQMGAEAIQHTRHAAPYHALAPHVEERYTAYLADYVGTGPGSVVLRDNIARFYRANNPGLVVLGVGLLGAVLPTERRVLQASARLWMGVAGFFMLAAMGPFAPVTRDIALPGPYNPVWLGLHHLFPGSSLLLEPFRYSLPVGAAVGIAASCGAVVLASRLGRWVLVALPALCLVESLTIAPVFRPLPTTTPTVPEVYSQLDDYIDEGAVLELPFFQFGSKLFTRTVFLNQRTHGRPIPHIVEGHVPAYLRENPATATLLAAEDPVPFFSVVPGDFDDFDDGIAALQADGVAAIILTPSLYKDPRVLGRVERFLRPWGPPMKVDGRWIYRL